MPPLTPVSTDGLELIAEPMEGAFTVLVPRGWTAQLHLQREHSLNRKLVSAASPDRATTVQLGDGRLPVFVEPGPFFDPQLLAFNPQMRPSPFQPANVFVQDYVRQCFGPAPGFRPTTLTPSEHYLRLIARTFPAHGPQPYLTAAAAGFEHHGNGPLMRCEVHAVTLRLPPMWFAEVFTVSTSGDLDAARRVAERMVASCQFTPAWAAAAQRLHNQRMAMGQQQLDHTRAMAELQRQGHEQRMHDIQQWGQANTRTHEQRMGMHDATMGAWQARQASDDSQQQARVNAIREEHTVADTSGATYQVSSHHERYYVNKRDNTYIGTGGATERHDLARTHGVNPDDFEEVKVVR